MTIVSGCLAADVFLVDRVVTGVIKTLFALVATSTDGVVFVVERVERRVTGFDSCFLVCDRLALGFSSIDDSNMKGSKY